MSSSFSSSSSSRRPLWKRLALLPPLLFALYLLSDDEYASPPSSFSDLLVENGYDGDRTRRRRHHLAVWTALRRHPPCLRVYRALSELSLLLACAAGALWVWERNGAVGSEVVGALLFGPIEDDDVVVVGGGGTTGFDGGGGGGGGRRRDSAGRLLFFFDDDDDEGEEEDDVEGEGSGTEDEKRGGDGTEREDDGDGDGDDAVRAGGEGGAPRGAASSKRIDIDVDEDDEDEDPFDRVWPTTTTATSSRDDDDDDDDDDVPDDRDVSPSPPPRRGRRRRRSTPLPSWSERYPPPPPAPPGPSSVLSASLDLFLSILVSLFFFTISSAEGGKYIDGTEGERDAVGLYRKIAGVAAPAFPLALFAGSAFASVWPWRKRKSFWNVMSLTAGAPFHPVTFRDGFVGDVLTSSVRPLQDLAFTSFYVLSGLRGWWSSSYGLADAASPLETSWLLHTVVLPACMVTPLWCRYLQNLRQTYDEKRRWPYLGNALKYFAAAMVGLVGSYDPDAKGNPVWLGCFAGATLYQVWWDVFMDWELLVPDVEGAGSKSSSSSSGGGGGDPRTRRPRRRFSFFSFFPYRLRPNRLYRFKSTYYFIFVVNFALRFCWTLTFLPRKYLDKKSGVLMDAFGGDDFQALFASSALASAEIVRRTLWGLLRLELESIKRFPREEGEEEERTRAAASSTTMTEEGGDDGRLRPGSGIPEPEHANVVVPITSEELTPMSIELSGDGAPSTTPYDDRRRRGAGFLSSNNPTLMRHAGTFLNVPLKSDMSQSTDLQIVTELCLYATAFASLGIVMAAHRQVM